MKYKPNFDFLPYGFHFLDEDDIKAVVNSLCSGSLTQGSGVSDFEWQFSKLVGSDFAVAVSNATQVYIACLAANLNDTAVTSKYICGHTKLDFIWVENVFGYNQNVTDLSQLHKILKRNIKAVQFTSHSNRHGLFELSEEFDFSIIEDAAPGAKYETNGAVGGCHQI